MCMLNAGAGWKNDGWSLKIYNMESILEIHIKK